MSWTQEEMNEVYSKVHKLALTDGEFREELMKDSKAAVEKLTGRELPDGFQIKVIENDPAYQATFVLPDFVGDEMDEADLDEVAGGVAFIVGISACALAFNVSGNICAAAVGK